MSKELVRGAGIRYTPAGRPVIAGPVEAVVAEVSRARRAGEWDVPGGYITEVDGMAWAEIRYLKRPSPYVRPLVWGGIILAVLALVSILAVWLIGSALGMGVIVLVGIGLLVTALRTPAGPSTAVNVNVEVTHR